MAANIARPGPGLDTPTNTGERAPWSSQPFIKIISTLILNQVSFLLLQEAFQTVGVNGLFLILRVKRVCVSLSPINTWPGDPGSPVSPVDH